MVEMKLTREEFEEFKAFVRRQRLDWPAVFSYNGYDLWPFITYGKTKEEDRINIRGASPFLDRIAEALLEYRGSDAGRLFIDERGAFTRPEGSNRYHKFVRFSFVD